MALRWVHFVAGILWVGLLYFFNLINFPFVSSLDANGKALVTTRLMPRALWWFRWSSVVTVFVGFGYWSAIVGADARSAQAAGIPASPGWTMGSFVLIWTLAFAVEMGVMMSPVALRSGFIVGIITAIAVIAASYFYVSLNQHGWESNRTLAIGVGGGLGWVMMFNVWGLLWRMQKKMIRWTEANVANGTPIPAEATKFARLSFLTARVGFWLSFPMLFFMGAASHYAIFVNR